MLRCLQYLGLYCLLGLFGSTLLAQGTTISGTVFLPAGDPAEEPVTMNLDDGMTIITTTTDEDGNYSFTDLPFGDYTLWPTIAAPYPGICLSIADRCLLNQEVNGEMNLNPLQLLAADLDEDGAVDFTDLGTLADLIRDYPESVGVPGVRFSVNEDGVPTGSNIATLPDLEIDEIVDFYLIPLGDIDFDCPATSIGTAPLDLEIIGPDQLAPGEEFCIDVVANNYDDLTGFQFGLRWTQFMSSIGTITPGPALEASGFSVSTDPGAGSLGATYYVNPCCAMTFPPGTVLMTACFTVSPDPVFNEVSFGFGHINNNGQLPNIIGTRNDCLDFNGTGDGPGADLIIPIGVPVSCGIDVFNTGLSPDLCCYDLSISEQTPSPQNIFGLRFTFLDGNTVDLSSEGLAAGYQFSGGGSNTMRTISRTDGAAIGADNSFYNFCFDNVATLPQYVRVDYLDSNLEGVVCSDSLLFECDGGGSNLDCEVAVDTIDISTGIDVGGNLLPDQTIDPFWQLMNLPPLDRAIPSGVAPPNMYTVSPFNGSNWNTLDQPYPPAKPINVRDEGRFGANNAFTFQPWRVQRHFCLCEETEVVIKGAMQADDQGTLYLYDTPTGSPFGLVGNTYPFGTTDPFKIDSTFCYTTLLPAGQYHLEVEMLNTGSTAMGMTVGAQVYTADGTPLLLERGQEGCQFGTITAQKINDLNCDGERSPDETPLQGWTFNLRDTVTNQMYSGVTDAFGEIVWRLLPYGTYELTEVVQVPWVPSTNLPLYVTIDANNPVGQVDVLNRSPESCTCIDADIFSLEETGPEGECCYTLRIDNEFGPFYDSIALTGVGITATLLNSLATYGTVSVSNDTIYVAGLVPTGTDIPLFDFCVDLEGAGNVEVIWYAAGEVVCSDLFPVECPDNCQGFQAENVSQDPCCLLLDFDNIGSDVIQALDVRIISGAKVDGLTQTLPPGYFTAGGFSPTRRLVHRQDGAPLPADVDGILGFCFKEVTSSPQVVTIDYLGPDYSTIVCSDTLFFECELSPECLELEEESVTLNCEENQLRLTFLAQKPLDYVDSVGLVKIHITAPSSIDTVIIDTLTPALYPGDVYFFDELFNYDPNSGEDSICILITAHDGPEERVCCFVDSLCLPIPVCDPCDYYSAEMVPFEDDSCCYYFVVEDFNPSPGYFDSLDLNVISSLNGGFGFTPILNGDWVFNNNFGDPGWVSVGQTSGPDTIASLCLNASPAPFDTSFFQFDFYHFGDPDTTICSDTVFGVCTEEIVEPCDSIVAELLVDEMDSCCYYFVVEELYATPGYFDSLQFSVLSNVQGVNTFQYITNDNWSFNNAVMPGQWNRTGFVSGPDTIAYLCLNPEFPPLDTSTFILDFFHFGEQDTLVCSDTLTATCTDVEIDPCDSLSAFLELMPIGEDSCCFDLYVVNNYSDGPLTSVNVDLLDGPFPAFSAVSTFPVPAGWNFPIENQAAASYTFTHSSGLIPLGTTKLMSFCLEETNTNDSTYVGVSFQLEEEEICADTVAAFCPDCGEIIPDTLLCDNDGNYLYRFSFTNLSNEPVNAVRILNSVNSPDAVLNSQLFNLPVTVPIGGTYSGTLPVVIDDVNGDGEVCFDVILRYIIPEQNINIECCFIEYCFEVPPCEELPTAECPDPNFAEPITVLDDLEAPVCGCDGQQYQNWTFAVQSGVLSWTAAVNGECDFGNGNFTTPDITLSPNPANNSIMVSSTRPGPATLDVVSFVGQAQQRQAVNFVGRNAVRLDVSRNTPGVYTVIVRYPDGEMAYRQFVKQ